MAISHDAPAKEWVELGLAVVTHKAKGANLTEMSFTAAQANGLLQLSAEGARMLDMEGRSKVQASLWGSAPVPD